MHSQFQSKVIRSLLLGGTATAALSISSPALAVSVSNIAITSIQSNVGQCDVSFSATVTNNGVATFTSGISTTAIGAPTIGALPGSTFGTLQLARTIPVSLGSPPTGPLYIQFFGSPNNGPPGSLARLAIPNATLQSAGGACLNLIPNLPPTAIAGPDVSVRETQQVVLAGSGTDPEGQPLTYSWTFIAGTPGTLSSTTAAAPTLTAPSVSLNTGAIYELTVSDGVTSRSDQVNVNYVNNTAPVVASTPLFITAAGGSTVNLTGTATDLNNDPLTYLWQYAGGAGLTILSGGTTLTPSVRLANKTNVAQLSYIRLDANDGIDPSNTVLVEFTIPANVGPTANAGSTITAGGGSTVSLNGSGSTDGDGDTLSYAWSQLSGPSVTLTGANTATPSFTAPVTQPTLQTLTFRLVVNDGFGNSAPSTVTVEIPTNAPPTANAGTDATVTGGTPVALAGTASDLENDPLNYQWTQTAGPPVTLTGATTLTPGFTAPPKTGAAQVLTFSLTANDGTSTSAADTVDITIPANVGPTANAGPDALVGGGGTVTLSGAVSSDGDGDPLTYSWVQTGGTAVTLSSATAVSPTFVAPLGGLAVQTLTFDLVVSDGVTSSVADSVTISVNPNSPPVADAGADQGPISTGQTVTLTGSASTDPDGNPLTYSWTQISGPAATLVNPASASPTFVAPNVSGTQNLVFQLVVNDGTVDSPPDTVTIAVRAVGSITVIQRVVGADGSFSFTSDVPALAGTVATVNGVGQRAAGLVPAGAHSLIAGDARAAGYALTAIACNDSDSVVNLTNRSVAIALSPNENLICTFTSTNTRDAALQAIGNFLTARNAVLLANRPDLQRRLDRLNDTPAAGGSASAFGLPVPGSGLLPVSANISARQAHAATSLGTVRAAARDGRGNTPFDIWAEAYFGSLDFAGQEGRFSLIYTGADYRLSDTLLVGGLVQFDRYTPQGTRSAGTASGNGWMAGPYVTARLAKGLYADVRAAWGSSDNTISPLGTYVDAFDTSRALYSGALIGEIALGDATRLRPEVSLRYIEERQKGYTDRFSVTIPSQTVGQGDVAFSPRIDHSIPVSEGWTLRPFAEAEGILSFGLDRQTVFANEFRMRIKGGIDLTGAGSFRAGVAAFHDGIGAAGYKSTGANLSVSFGF